MPYRVDANGTVIPDTTSGWWDRAPLNLQSRAALESWGITPAGQNPLTPEERAQFDYWPMTPEARAANPASNAFLAELNRIAPPGQGRVWRFNAAGQTELSPGEGGGGFDTYVGGTNISALQRQGLMGYGGRPDAIPYSVPTTSIRGTLRYGDTGYRGPVPAPAPVTMGLAPERPLGVPENWVWDPATNAWRPPGQVSTVVGVNTRGRNTGLGSTTETAAPRYTATPPNEVPPVALYNNNQDGTVSPPGMAGPVGMWNYNSPSPGRPSPEDIRLANLGYIGNRIQYAGMA